ncbi:hypothetical protein AVEN_172820-1 [Araneus ventricosus]|uniref:DDE-1 domain-containing protein n=1 Tax=Araneus ventricosus TaxID=182803 RepID=A0A4Y2BJY1_ARAVE|nr:hypothetical protein AVEN_172820-1 [Araneus ventricosus]
MTGHQKLKPLVIGTTKNPRCFKGAKTLVYYDFNKNSWMTSEIWEKWVQKLDKRMIAECHKNALVFDNCPAHPKEIIPKLENVSFLLATQHYIKTAANGSRGYKKNSKYTIAREQCKKLSLRLRTINPCQRSTYGKAYQKFPKHGNTMSQIVLLAKVLPKLDSLSAMRIRQVRRMKTILEQRFPTPWASDGVLVGRRTPDKSQIGLAAKYFLYNWWFTQPNRLGTTALEELKKMWIQPRQKEEIIDDVLIDFLSLDSEAETSETLTELDILDSVKNKNNTAMN